MPNFCKKNNSAVTIAEACRFGCLWVRFWVRRPVYRAGAGLCKVNAPFFFSSSACPVVMVFSDLQGRFVCRACSRKEKGRFRFNK
jgi:hypothetical protein